MLAFFTAFAGLAPGALPRRAALGQALALAGAPALAPSAALAAADVFASTGGKKLSREQINGKLSRIPVCALVNPDDEPYLAGGGGVGFFFLDPQEALLALRVLQQTQPEARIRSVPLTDVYFPLVREPLTDIGGTLLLRAPRRDVVLANRALQFNQPANSGRLLPTSLDESKGQVPVFYSEQVALTDPKSGEVSYPFFLAKADLDAAFVELAGDKAAGDAADKPRRSGQGTSGATEMPIGQVRIATLDGLVDQSAPRAASNGRALAHAPPAAALPSPIAPFPCAVASGADVDLSQAVVVGSRSALRLSQRLEAEQRGAPVVEKKQE